jgi:pteridine reductase
MTVSVESTPPVALVTGGRSRIGRAIAMTFAESGMDVALTYKDDARSANEVVRLIERLGRRCLALQADLADPNAIDTLQRGFDQHFARLDVLVNNASIFAPTPLTTLSRDVYETFMRVNALSPLLLIQRFAPLLAAPYRPGDPTAVGRVINIIDIHVLGQPLKGFTAYNASKAALLEITMSCAVELAPRITVNAIAPGVIGWSDFHTEDYRAEFLARVPMAREGTPEEVAKAALFLARDASYCTGQVIRVDGGRALT